MSISTAPAAVLPQACTSGPPGATGARARSTALLLWFAAALVLASVAGAGLRVAVAVGTPAIVLAAVAARLPRGPAAGVAALLGVLAVGGGVIGRSPMLVVAGTLQLAYAARAGWGVNRGRSGRRTWMYRSVTAVVMAGTALFVVYPTLLTVGFLAKPRDPVHEAAFALPHQRVSFRASDGVRLAGWYRPGPKGAVVVVHGGGGDREGAVRHATMLSRLGYGVLLYDARGRGQSEGHENAVGWRWHRDVRGAVDFLERRGVRRIGLLGLSTGAEAVVTEAADDPRVGAVIADGLQGRTPADTTVLPTGDRLSLQPAFAVVAGEIALVRGEQPPPPLAGLVRRLAATRPLLLVGTVAFEREFDRAYTHGTRAKLWELPTSAHTHGLQDHPVAYAARVRAVLSEGLQPRRRP